MSIYLYFTSKTKRHEGSFIVSSAATYLIEDGTNTIRNYDGIYSGGKYLGDKNKKVAKYYAFLIGLERLLKHSHKHIIVCTNEEMVDELLGIEKINKMLQNFDSIEFNTDKIDNEITYILNRDVEFVLKNKVDFVDQFYPRF